MPMLTIDVYIQDPELWLNIVTGCATKSWMNTGNEINQQDLDNMNDLAHGRNPVL